MWDSNLFDSRTVNVKKEFWKNSVQPGKGLKQPGLRCYLCKSGTISYRHRGILNDTVLYK